MSNGKFRKQTPSNILFSKIRNDENIVTRTFIYFLNWGKVSCLGKGTNEGLLSWGSQIELQGLCVQILCRCFTCWGCILLIKFSDSLILPVRYMSPRRRELYATPRLKRGPGFPALSVPSGQSTFDFGTFRDRWARSLCVSLSHTRTCLQVDTHSVNISKSASTCKQIRGTLYPLKWWLCRYTSTRLENGSHLCMTSA